MTGPKESRSRLVTPEGRKGGRADQSGVGTGHGGRSGRTSAGSPGTGGGPVCLHGPRTPLPPCLARPQEVPLLLFEHASLARHLWDECKDAAGLTAGPWSVSGVRNAAPVERRGRGRGGDGRGWAGVWAGARDRERPRGAADGVRRGSGGKPRLAGEREKGPFAGRRGVTTKVKTSG